MMTENRIEKRWKNRIFVIFEVEYFEFGFENQKKGPVNLLVSEATRACEILRFLDEKP